jgi:hypothetical protein
VLDSCRLRRHRLPQVSQTTMSASLVIALPFSAARLLMIKGAAPSGDRLGVD